ncbi:hypothetical protein [Actinoallomurus sp. NPDC052274]|uniref:hypothetical protein n=1 Tax=Actinoallomurus sp. NPDC052274 TaxID=3155420 RepID=UPI00341DC41A
MKFVLPLSKLPSIPVIAASAIAATMLAAPAQAASSSAPADVQQQVDQVISGHPDARQTGPGTVTLATESF